MNAARLAQEDTVASRLLLRAVAEAAGVYSGRDLDLGLDSHNGDGGAQPDEHVQVGGAPLEGLGSVLCESGQPQPVCALVHGECICDHGQLPLCAS